MGNMMASSRSRREVVGEPGISVAQLAATLVGVVYLAIGVVGFFVTGFGGFVQDTPDAMIGFDVNPFHNVIHAVVGLYLLFVASLHRLASEGALIGGGVVYLVAAVLGFNNSLQIISINDALAPDNFLHLVSGSAAVVIGLVSLLVHRSERTSDTIQRV